MQKAVLKPLIKRARRKKGEKKLFRFNIKDKASLPLIIKALCSFLLSGTSLIGGTTPLGFACAASVFNGFDGYVCFAASILGILFYGGGLLSAGKYIIASILFSLIYERFLPEQSKKNTACAVLAALSLLFSGSFILFATMSIGGFPLIYDAVILIVECATLWVSVLAFKTAIPLVFSLHVRRSLSTEDTFCRRHNMRSWRFWYRRSIFRHRYFLCVFCTLLCHPFRKSSRMCFGNNNGTCFMPQPRKD